MEDTMENNYEMIMKMNPYQLAQFLNDLQRNSIICSVIRRIATTTPPAVPASVNGCNARQIETTSTYLSI